MCSRTLLNIDSPEVISQSYIRKENEFHKSLSKPVKYTGILCLSNRGPQSYRGMFRKSLEKCVSKYFWETDLLLKGLDTL